MPFAINLLEALQQDTLLIFPQIILIATAAIMLWPGDLFVPKEKKHYWAFIAIAALAVSGLFVASTPIACGFSNMFKVDNTTKSFQYLILISGIITILLSKVYLDTLNKQTVEYYSLLLFSITGMLFLVGSIDLVSIYFSMELMALSIYILVAYLKSKERSIEAGIKYFLLGAFSSGIFLFGISLLFAVEGGTTTNLIELNEHLALIPMSNNLLMLVGIIMVILGFCFKVAAVPFHMWSPDIYDGAPTSITAFISVAPKIASIAAFLNVFGNLNNVSSHWVAIIACVAAGSMIIGNVAALKQQTMKRLLAYSGIAHMGYTLLGAMNADVTNGTQTVWLYMFAYLIMQFGIFTIVIFLQNKNDGERIDNFRGLAKTHPLLAFAMMVLMLGLAGIPPLLGFLSKFYIFKLAIEHDQLILTTIALLTSAISAYYYLAVIALMYFKEPVVTIEPRPLGFINALLISSSCTFTLLGICFSSYIMDLVAMVI